MDHIYLFLFIILIICLWEGFIWLYKYISSRVRGYFVHHRHFDECWKSTENKVLALEVRHNERFVAFDKRVEIVEKLANNFERDMERYHRNINKDIDERIKKIFNRMESIETLQKEQGTSLFAQAEIIEDLRKKKK